MNQNPLFDDDAASVARDFDQTILSGILDIGDDAMRRDLCAQLLSDFRRMTAGLDESEPVMVSKIAHEIKGLASTIGAQRLAALAQTLHHSAEQVSAGALAVLVLSVSQEMDRVVSVLEAAERASLRP
ncbi:MAG: HPt domain protein [Rhodobacteraceae bacterium HLUCCA12]|nr:MAG: HPt domain protein [Rhodobacteraceae bacterium HLUCCA12]